MSETNETLPKGAMGVWQWVGATGTAAFTGTAALIAYVHANFPSKQELTDHKAMPAHVGGVTIERYSSDLNKIYKALEETNKNLKDTNDQLNRIIGRLNPR